MKTYTEENECLQQYLFHRIFAAVSRDLKRESTYFSGNSLHISVKLEAMSRTKEFPRNFYNKKKDV